MKNLTLSSQDVSDILSILPEPTEPQYEFDIDYQITSADVRTAMKVLMKKGSAVATREVLWELAGALNRQNNDDLQGLKDRVANWIYTNGAEEELFAFVSGEPTT